jgi:hypothetical protein
MGLQGCAATASTQLRRLGKVHVAADGPEAWGDGQGRAVGSGEALDLPSLHFLHWERTCLHCSQQVAAVIGCALRAQLHCEVQAMAGGQEARPGSPHPLAW